MIIKTEVIKGKELAERFRKAGGVVQDKFDKVLLKAGFVVERAAKKLVHVLTGRCRASIATRLVTPDVQVGTIVEYAPRLEKLYPFLKPALVNKTVEIKQILHKGMSKIMGDLFKKGFTQVF